VYSPDTLNAKKAKHKEIEVLDLVTLELNVKGLTVGRERHMFCVPLFDPRVLKNGPELEVTSFVHDEKEKEQG